MPAMLRHFGLLTVHDCMYLIQFRGVRVRLVSGACKQWHVATPERRWQTAGLPYLDVLQQYTPLIDGWRVSKEVHLQANASII